MAVYVYAIVPRTVRLSRGGRRAAARLRVVRGRSAAAIVADRRRPPAPDARALAAHDRVVRRIARDVPALLPVRFGTMFDDDPAVAARLTSRIADWGGALRAVARREQMTLRVFGAPAAPPRTARPGSPATGTAYLRERAGTLARAREAPELAPLRAALGPLLADERVTRHDRGALRLTAYHLIARGSARAYRRALARVTAAAGVRMLASGPWPPYAFAPEVGR